MKRNFIGAFILLATLSMVNAQTKFGACPIPDPPTPVLLQVKLVPDPVVKGKTFDVTLSGTLAVDVADDKQTIIDVVFLDSTGVPITDTWFTQDFCTSEGIKCPLKAGTAFTTTAKAVAVPDNVATGDNLVVDVFNLGGNVFDGCAYSDPLTFNSVSSSSSGYFLLNKSKNKKRMFKKPRKEIKKR